MGLEYVCCCFSCNGSAFRAQLSRDYLGEKIVLFCLFFFRFSAVVLVCWTRKVGGRRPMSVLLRKLGETTDNTTDNKAGDGDGLTKEEQKETEKCRRRGKKEIRKTGAEWPLLNLTARRQQSVAPRRAAPLHSTFACPSRCLSFATGAATMFSSSVATV